MMAKNIDNVVRQTYRYFYEDGLVEMALGLLFIAVGLWLVIWSGLTSSTLSGLFLAIGLPLLIFGGALVFKRVIKKLKERITYPRTGYVSYRQNQPDRGRWFVLGIAFLLAIAALLLPDSFNQMSVIVGTLMGVIFVYMGYRVEIWRFYLVGAIALILGIGLPQFGLEEVLALGLLFIGTGVVMLIAGTVTLVVYLRHHPEPHEAAQSEGS